MAFAPRVCDADGEGFRGAELHRHPGRYRGVMAESGRLAHKGRSADRRERHAGEAPRLDAALFRVLQRPHEHGDRDV